MKSMGTVLSLVAFVALLGLSASAQQTQSWATVKGRVVFPEDKPIPERKPLNITQDKDHCLAKGPILDESMLVNPKNRGIKNVVVWLRPNDKDPKSKFLPSQIHPDDAKRKPAEIVIDQPQCMFVDRITIARPKDKLIVKNSSPVAHNFFWNSGNNGNYNVTIPKMDQWVMPQPLQLESPPIKYSCTIHGWMTGYVRIFDHPYVAVTDENGYFEIKNAPVGKFRIVFWHENGFLGGAAGRFGQEIDIQAPVTELKPTVFDITPR